MKMLKQFLSANEAMAYASLEARVQVVTGYPGTPSTEIIETIMRLSSYNKEASLANKNTYPYVEWSVNEKVAVEVAAAASFSGLRSMCVMKNVGLNVALDFLMTINLTGINGGMLIVSADDVGGSVTQNEQDTRHVCHVAHLPVLEPMDAQETVDMTLWAFQFSEKIGLPVVLRLTGRVSRSFQNVRVGSARKVKCSEGEFRRNLDRFLLVGATVRKSHKYLHEKLEKVRETFERVPFSWSEQNGREKIGIVVSGYVYNCAKEAIKALHIQKRVALLKIGTPYPLPRKTIIDFVSNVRTLLVMEEVEPIIEQEVKSILKDANLNVKVKGRTDKTIHWSGQISVSQICSVFCDMLSLPTPEPIRMINEIEELLGNRPGTFCAGCPHLVALYALKKVLLHKKINYVYTSDIGCYGMSIFPPLNIGDTNMCMGSSFGLACGFAKSLSEDVLILASIGDSTFFHAGIPALINAIHNKASVIFIIHDNETIAMTGGQPTPSSGVNARGTVSKKIKIEDICKACGVDSVKVLNPFNLKRNIEMLKEIVQLKRTCAIVFRGKCILLREKKGALEIPKVDQNLCSKCLICVNEFACPAIKIAEDGKIYIMKEICTSCGACLQVCPSEAIMFT